MKIEEYFKYIVEVAHTVVMATVDDEGLPITCVIDIMDWDSSGLYFLTAKGKGFYDRLKKRGYVAFSCNKGEDTLSSVAVSVRGKVEEVGEAFVERLISKNLYVNEIYPTEKSKEALTVFKICQGNGEWFDLSKKPIERFSFSFGDVKSEKYKGHSYFINDNCVGCGKCVEVCPQNAICGDKLPFVVVEKNCLHCGNCERVCNVKAVEKK